MSQKVRGNRFSFALQWHWCLFRIACTSSPLGGFCQPPTLGISSAMLEMLRLSFQSPSPTAIDSLIGDFWANAGGRINIYCSPKELKGHCAGCADFSLLFLDRFDVPRRIVSLHCSLIPFNHSAIRPMTHNGPRRISIRSSVDSNSGRENWFNWYITNIQLGVYALESFI